MTQAFTQSDFGARAVDSIVFGAIILAIILAMSLQRYWRHREIMAGLRDPNAEDHEDTVRHNQFFKKR